MTDAKIRIPTEVRNRLAEVTAAEGLSLRAYLARFADSLLTPAERAERAERTRSMLRSWNGYNPGEAGTADLDAELDDRLRQPLPERPTGAVIATGCARLTSSDRDGPVG